MIPRHVFREYDIRGVADRDLSDDLARRIGRRFAEAVMTDGASKAPLIAVGRDGRLSSPRLFAALTQGLTEAGANVIDIGIGPTPQLYFAAHHLETDGAVMITGSHNPGPDNGFKLMRKKASFFGPEIQVLADRVAETLGDPTRPKGSVEARDVSDAYIENVRSCSRLPNNARVKFVVDAGNGSAGPLALRTFRALGFEPEALYCDIDGHFPNHHPDPTVPENVAMLRDRVLATNADLGIAFDGDGDRLGAIDDKGEIIWGDKLMILFSRAVLAEHPGATILGEVKCSETLFADITKHGGKALYSKTGHSLIKTRMKAENALLAGEMSGHLFFADRYQGFDDATYAAVRLLEIVAKEGRKLSELLSDVPVTFATPEIRVDCPDAIKFNVVSKVLARYRETHRVLDIDGARIDFGNGAWGLCRASNTQPVLVLRIEALTEARRDAIHSELESIVQSTRNSIESA
jgi:phosphomannomutase / phosphoglucomutase